jgi:transposase InsO family protein
VLAENVTLRDTVEFLVERLACAERRLKAAHIREPCSLAERLHTLWCIEYFGISRRQVPRYFGVARSPVWRWLRRLQDGIGLCGRKCQPSMRRTSEQLERLVWGMAAAKPGWGGRPIALVLATLSIFPASSTVRNISLRPKPRPEGTPAAATVKPEEKKPRQIIARYPNHLWSVDRSRAWRWRIWPTCVLVAIDHFSRKVVASYALEGPNGGWAVDALKEAFLCHGAPTHTITDQAGVFISDVAAAPLRRWRVKQRFGAVGKHGSVAVTERAIRTLKCEWLRRVPPTKGLDHLQALLAELVCYYNSWRPHTTLKGAVPELVHAGNEWSPPARTAKTVPAHIGRRFFPETRVTGFRLAA